ncbi:Meiosis-specific transcription factor NDT80 [Lachnellula cervina]|uniref:Meiosis-specific transcription factor NDT80 n=1 Tax=Lachnellula cervina TaxID=1316786 RepID=A0A7D8UKU3_9HELO|nr:Meiosis-specific transcription factor NDT80 [Lachnellula cervina]
MQSNWASLPLWTIVALVLVFLFNFKCCLAVIFNPDSGTQSPVYSIEPAVQNSSSSSSSLAFSPFTNIYQPSLSGSTYSSGASSYFSPSSSLFSMPDLKPRLSSLNASPGLAPPTRSPALPHPGSPLATRDLYTGTTPQLRRTSDLLSRSPSSISGGLRGVPLSPSSSGFASPTNMEGSIGGTACPPLNATEMIYEIQTGDGQNLRPEIFGRIDKGFFQADGDWTCYRRNYFSLNCSYTLQPALPTGTIFLAQNGHKGYQVYAFSMSIAAVVDGRDGKSIELVQHTPKRDKGPQEKPGRVTLAPRPPPSHGMYADGGLGSSSRGGSLYENPAFGQNPNQPQIEATFERIQFKNATANNGKRRAAQQYYHLLIELFADVGQQHPDRYMKIAFRMSAPMVVRGRSPGHYQSERRGSNASTGPGSGGAGGAGSYTPSAGTSRTPGDMNMSGTPSMLPGPSYGNSYDNRSHHYRAHIAPLQIPMEPVLSAEEAKSIEESPGYLYYPGPIYEGSHHEARYQLPSMSDYTTSKVKQEYGQGGYVLPSLASTQDSLNRHCGRWEGTAESKGYFPTSLIQQELNIS